nr:ribosomal protein S2 [Dryopteris crassirhizoma]
MEEGGKKYYSREEKKVIFQRLPSTSAHPGYQEPPTLYYQRYSYGFRHRRAIIDLEKTPLFLKIACNVIGSIIHKKGHLLLVNTNPLCDNTMKRMARRTNQSHINSKWIGGFLTNWEHMKHEERFKYSSTWHSSPRFFKMQRYFEGLITRQILDGLVISNARRDFYAIFEANWSWILIAFLVDSVLPEELHRLVTHPIPVNNNSIWFTNPFCQLVTKAVIHSKKARKPSKKAEEIRKIQRIRLALFRSLKAAPRIK